MVGPIFALALYGLILLIALPLPIILGFTVVRADANRLGEPGWVWALLTIPLGWLAVLAYVVVRALLPRR